jgi:hypothetical protein
MKVPFVQERAIDVEGTIANEWATSAESAITAERANMPERNHRG